MVVAAVCLAQSAKVLATARFPRSLAKFTLQIMSTACFSLFVALTRNGVGRHAEYFTYVRPDLFTVFFELAWWYAWIIVVAYSSIKISIACFLLRLADHRRHWRWILHSIVGKSYTGTCRPR